MPNIVRGRRVGGLLRYLFGPGRREEHRDPHLVAGWDGAGPLHRLEPSVGSDGRRDFRRLVDLLEQPVRNGRNPPRTPVWHCSIRTHPVDRGLSDAQWAHIAGEVVAGVGLAPHGDSRGVRWVAVRHGADHIHIVATLVRQDRRTAYARNDRWRAQAVCRDLEERYGLYRVGPADRTSHRRPTAAELNKGRRTGRSEPARDRLRREVRFAAAAAASTDDFFDLLRRAGVLVEARHSVTVPGRVTGYKVGLADYTTADGTPVWYGGSRLAPDLSLPRLRVRWAGVDGPLDAGLPAAAYGQAAEQVRAAVAEIRRTAAHAQDGSVSIGLAVADIVMVAARYADDTRRNLLDEAAEALDRAARPPYGRTPAGAARAGRLRAAARMLGVAGRDSQDDKALVDMLRLIVTLSLFADALAELRDSQRRLHQARAARAAARLLRAAADTPAGHLSVTGRAVTEPLTGPPTPRRDPRRQAAPANTAHGR